MTTPLTAPLAARILADVLGADLHPGCPHVPPCPPVDATNHDEARVVLRDPAGWSLLCNHVIVFDDTGELLPDDGPTGCHAEPPHRPEPRHCTDLNHQHCPCGDEES